jgi:hypothetical protein
MNGSPVSLEIDWGAADLVTGYCGPRMQGLEAVRDLGFVSVAAAAGGDVDRHRDVLGGAS